MTKYSVRVERFRSTMDVAYVTVEAPNEEEAFAAAEAYTTENEADVVWLMDYVEETDDITTEYSKEAREVSA